MNRYGKLSRCFKKGDKVRVKNPQNLPSFYSGEITRIPGIARFATVRCTETTNHGLWSLSETYGVDENWLTHYE